MKKLLMCLSILGLSACETEVKTVDACGDGIIQAEEEEECDGVELGGASCESLGFHGGALSCAADCTLDLSACEDAGRCGDGEVQSLDEDCEGSDLNGQSCQSRGYTGGTLGCAADCRFDVSGCVSLCGNALVEPDETCDDGGIDPGDGCSTACQLETGWACEGTPSLCAPICGDGLIVGPEACDGPTEGLTCLGNGYFGGSLSCDACAFTGCLGLMAVDGGYNHTCALDHEGNAWCWGLDSDGQLGNGAGPGSHHPVATTMPAGIHFGALAVSTNAHVCTLDTTGNAWCWGRNGSGQLGDDSGSNRDIPTAVQMPAVAGFTHLCAGFAHSCALDTTGNAWCWGDGSQGQLGRVGTTASFRPVAVTMPPGVTFSSIAAGDVHTCGLTSTGVVYCWGLNSSGQLGDGTTITRTSPVFVTMPGGTAIVSLEAASYSTYALDAAGQLITWGGFALARTTGSGSSPWPAVMPSGVSFASVEGGEFFACALDTTGNAWCWGDCSNGVCGIVGSFTDLIKPVAMPLGTTFVSLGLGGHFGCGFTALGALWCWGENGSGQLGDDTNLNRPVPTRTYWP